MEADVDLEVCDFSACAQTCGCVPELLLILRVVHDVVGASCIVGRVCSHRVVFTNPQFLKRAI